MKSTKNLFLTALTLAAFSASARAQTSAPTAPAQPVVTAADIQALKDALAAQQQQIQALRDELHRKDQVAQQAQSTTAQAQALREQETVSHLVSDFADLKSVNNTTA